MNEIEHPELLEELRVRIQNRESVVQTMRFLIQRLHLGPGSRLVVIGYFRAAFSIQLSAASKLGAWQFFDGGSWSDEMIEAEMMPLLRSQRK